MTVSISIEGVARFFDGRPVLRDVTIRVAPSEIFGIVGPSGVGKTTLLRIINLLERPDAGRVRFDGADPPADERALLALRRRMVMVPQSPLLFRGTPFYNVSFGLCARGFQGAEMRAKTFKALEDVGLLDKAGARVSRLSAGEAQRVAFARAAVVLPDLLLLDEFTANLDPANVNILEQAVRRFNAETGATVVCVTHNMFQAKRLAHRVALLLDGRMVEVAPTNEFFERPQDPRTAAFVRGDIAY